MCERALRSCEMLQEAATGGGHSGETGCSLLMLMRCESEWAPAGVGWEKKRFEEGRRVKTRLEVKCLVTTFFPTLTTTKPTPRLIVGCPPLASRTRR